MTSLADIGEWISRHESLLSGLAAMIVVGGVVLSTLSVGLRQLGRSRGKRDRRTAAGAKELSRSLESSRPGTSDQALSAAGEPPIRMTFKMLTAPSPHPTKFANSHGVRIAYNDRGTGPPTVIYSPGIISHLNLMENLPITRRTFASLESFARILVFDKRGQGLSDPTISAPSLEERTADIEAVMDDAGVDRGILLALSESGPMSLHFAYTHPERVQGLVLVGTTARFSQSPDFPIGIPIGALERMPRVWGKGTLRDLFFPSISRHEIDEDTYKSFEALIGSSTAIRQVVEMMIAADVRALLPDIRVPTLIIHFTGDLAVPIRLGRYLADHIPGAEFLEVNSVDHGDIAQSPEAVTRIREFCERVAQPT